MVTGSDRFSRLTEWWRPKAGVLVSLLLFGLAVQVIEFFDSIEFLFYSIVTLSGFAITGYLLNDWADIESDRKVGKPNSLEELSIPVRFLMLIFFLAITSLPWLVYFGGDTLSWLLIIVQLILLVIYPVPPIRLKRFASVAVIIDALYAYSVPALLAWHTLYITFGLEKESAMVYLSLVCWMFGMGIRHIFNHHVSDMASDRVTGSSNLALHYSPKTLRNMVQKTVFPLELISCLLFLGLIFQSEGFFPLIMVFLAAYFGYTQFSSKGADFSVGFSQIGLDRFSSFWLGLSSALILCLDQKEYMLVAVVFVLLFSNVFRHPIWKISSIYGVKRITSLVLFPFQVVSLVFNWSLYYFRKWVLKWTEERNWGEHYHARLEAAEVETRKLNGVVGLFNQNYHKYTETFVEGHLKHLPFHVIPFHGWPSPMHVGKMVNLISDYGYVQKAWYSLAELFNVSTQDKENGVIARRLIDENVDVILAEFGTMAQRVLPVSKMTGIPVVVIFHGYDAWHRKVLQENDYSDLFVHAAHVIGVSQDLCSQLSSLGCDRQKLTYMPCYINLDLFTPVNRDFSRPQLLSVGRFTSTKAPHLTLLAFNEVLKEFPNARLTMIGSDDDGSTMELCLSLIQALDISDKVVLKGVVSPKEIYAFMSESSILVQHSITTPLNGDKEGTPAVVMEALATGLPVVATNHAGIAEVVETEKNGVLVTELDYNSMAVEIVRLLKDRALLQKLSSGAVASIANNQLITNHTNRMELILKKAISKE